MTLSNFKHLAPESKALIDVSSILVVFGTLAEVLPALAALASLIWSIIRIAETRTVQGWLGRSPSPTSQKEKTDD